MPTATYAYGNGLKLNCRSSDSEILYEFGLRLHVAGFVLGGTIASDAV